MRAPIVYSVAIACLFAGTTVSGQSAATVCKDGSTSAASGRGACSGHGGVNGSATKQAKRAVKAEQKAEVASAKAAGTSVTCADGSASNPGRGACSHHGGIRVGASANATLPRTTPAPEASPRTRSTPAPRSHPAPMAPAPAATTSRPTTMAPASGRGEDNDPTGAIAQCKDGMYSHAANRRGACSRHRGVAKWM